MCRTCCLSRYEIIIVQGRDKREDFVCDEGREEEKAEAATVAIERVEKLVQRLRLSE